MNRRKFIGTGVAASFSLPTLGFPTLGLNKSKGQKIHETIGIYKYILKKARFGNPADVYLRYKVNECRIEQLPIIFPVPRPVDEIYVPKFPALARKDERETDDMCVGLINRSILGERKVRISHISRRNLYKGFTLIENHDVLTGNIIMSRSSFQDIYDNQSDMKEIMDLCTKPELLKLGVVGYMHTASVIVSEFVPNNEILVLPYSEYLGIYNTNDEGCDAMAILTKLAVKLYI